MMPNRKRPTSNRT